MNKNTFLAILIFSVVQIACTFNKNTEADESTKVFNDNAETEISVNVNNDKADVEILRFPEKGEDTFKTSYFADTILYVPLETTNENFIKSIKQVWIDDSIILINDVRNLLMFSHNGKLLKPIGKTGKGPGEHQLIFNFDVIRDTIYLTSSGKRNWIKHALNGTFCEEIPFKDPPVWFSSTNNGQLARYHYEHGKIYIYNEHLNEADTIVVEHGVTVDRYRYGIINSFMTYFQKTPSGLLFSNYMSDTVWNIENGIKEPAFILKMKEKLLPRDKHIEFCQGDWERWGKMARPYQLAHLIPFSSSMIIFLKHWNEDNYSAIYLQDRKTREIKKYNTSYIYDDMIGQRKLSNFIFTNSTEFLIAVIYPHELKEELKFNNENIKKKASPLWLKQMNKIDKNDNPILVLIKVKNHLLNSK